VVVGSRGGGGGGGGGRRKKKKESGFLDPFTFRSICPHPSIPLL
jgi:hypothetical protein